MESNKVALITGGSSGIGLATARLLSRKGHTVYALDIKRLDDRTENIKYIQCDVTDYEKIKKVVHEIYTHEERIDYLFACAGKHLHANIEETTIEDFNNIIDVNIKGMFFIVKEVITIMKRNKKGSIVLMGSDQSLIAKSKNIVYGMTKAAIAQMAKSLAVDYAQFNIRANCICPGTIDTPFLAEALKYSSEKYGTSIENLTTDLMNEQPIRRLGKPEEVARAVVFLLSDESSYITGSLLSVNIMAKQYKMGIQVYYIDKTDVNLYPEWLEEDYLIQDDILLVDLRDNDVKVEKVRDKKEIITTNSATVKAKVKKFKRILERSTKFNPQNEIKYNKVSLDYNSLNNNKEGI